MVAFAEEQFTQRVGSSRILLIRLERLLNQLCTAHEGRPPLVLRQPLVLASIHRFQTKQKLGGRIIRVLDHG